MFAINDKGELQEFAFTHQTLEWGNVYQFNHCRRGKVIASLTAEDQEWYYVELIFELDTPDEFYPAGKNLPLRKSLVLSIDY